jgi:hypothetical protein
MKGELPRCDARYALKEEGCHSAFLQCEAACSLCLPQEVPVCVKVNIHIIISWRRSVCDNGIDEVWHCWIHSVSENTLFINHFHLVSPEKK